MGTCSCERYLDDRVEQHHSRLLGDDLFRGEVMFDELRDGGEAGAFETVLTLSEREGEGEGGRVLFVF